MEVVISKSSLQTDFRGSNFIDNLRTHLQLFVISGSFVNDLPLSSSSSLQRDRERFNTILFPMLSSHSDLAMFRWWGAAYLSSYLSLLLLLLQFVELLLIYRHL